MKVVVKDRQGLVGQMLSNSRDRKVYRIKYVGPEGLTALEIDEDGKEFGPVNEITWRCVKAIYSLVVPVEQIDDGKLVT